MTGNELTIGSVGVSVILSIVLRMIYGTFQIPGRWKPWISTGLGIGLAFLALWMATGSGVPFPHGAFLDYGIRGFMIGATATGIYEMTKTSPKSSG